MKQLAQTAALASLLLSGNALAAGSCPIGYQEFCPEGPRRACVCMRQEASVFPSPTPVPPKPGNSFWDGIRAAGSNPQSGSTDLSSTAVNNETWRNTSAQPSDKWTGRRPAVYTYVLVGEVGRGAEYTGSDARVAKARENLAALVREVRALEPSNSSAPDAASSNLFLVPSGKGGKSPKVAPYDFQLAWAYRSAFTSLMASRTELTGKLGGMGPFLVATRMPVGEIPGAATAAGTSSNGANTHIVLIDLSDAEPQSIVAFVGIFKDEIRKDDVKSDRELDHFRASVASALLKMNAAVPFIGSAYADAKSTLSGESKPDSTDAVKKSR